jgi:hypothetical protein
MDFSRYFLGRFFLLFVGLAGNTVGLALFYRNSMKKISTNIIYRTMLFMDSFFLCSQIFEDSALSLGLDLRTVSTLWCKIRYYWNYSIGLVSPWLLVYITMERYIAIEHNKILLWKTKDFQKLMITLIFIYNLIIYAPIAILREVFSEPPTANQTEFYVFVISLNPFSPQ